MKKIFLVNLFLLHLSLLGNGYSCNQNLGGLRFHNHDLAKPLMTSSLIKSGSFIPYQTQFQNYYNLCDPSALQMFIGLSLYLNSGQYYSSLIIF